MSNIENLEKSVYISPLTPDQPPFKGGRYVSAIGEAPCASVEKIALLNQKHNALLLRSRSVLLPAAEHNVCKSRHEPIGVRGFWMPFGRFIRC